MVALTSKTPAKVLAYALGLGRGFHHHERIPFPPTARVGSGLRVRFRGLVTAEGSALPLPSAAGFVAAFLRGVRLAAVLVFCVAMVPKLTTSFLRRY